MALVGLAVAGGRRKEGLADGEWEATIGNWRRLEVFSIIFAAGGWAGGKLLFSAGAESRMRTAGEMDCGD